MAAQPIYNPVIPCVYVIPGGMFPGRMLRFQGTVAPNAERFAINLQCGPRTDPRDDIALHLNMRFDQRCVVRNHLTNEDWGREELDGGIPIHPGANFEALLLCEPQGIKVAMNGQHFCEFAHRMPYQNITHITIDGDVSITLIGFEGAVPPQQAYMQPAAPVYQAYGAPPPPAYGAPSYGGPPQGTDTLMYNEQYAPVQQQRSGLGTGAAVGLGVGALAAGGLAGYAIGGGFSSDSPPHEEVSVVEFGSDDWMD